MKAQTKYLPCTSPDLRIGAVLETYHNERWSKFYIKNGLHLLDAEQIMLKYPDQIRVPALSHEDILSLGAVEEGNDPVINEDHKRYSIDSMVIVRYPDGVMDIRLFGDYVPVNIRTLPEFRDLMRFLGITCESRNKLG